MKATTPHNKTKQSNNNTNYLVYRITAPSLKYTFNLSIIAPSKQIAIEKFAFIQSLPQDQAIILFSYSLLAIQEAL